MSTGNEKDVGGKLWCGLDPTKKYNNDNKIYTENSFNALQIVIEKASKIDLNNEDDVSYWCVTLENKISSLTLYI